MPPETSTASTALHPGSDQDALTAMVLGVVRTLPWGRWIASAVMITSLLAGGLALLGFKTFSPSDQISEVRHVSDSLGRRLTAIENQRDSTLTEIRNVKFILCAQRQPTGDLAAEKCAERPR